MGLTLSSHRLLVIQQQQSQISKQQFTPTSRKQQQIKRRQIQRRNSGSKKHVNTITQINDIINKPIDMINEPHSPTISIPDTTASDISDSDELIENDLHRLFSSDDESATQQPSKYTLNFAHPIITQHVKSCNVKQQSRATQTDTITHLTCISPQLNFTNTTLLLKQLYKLLSHTSIHTLPHYTLVLQRKFYKLNYYDIIDFNHVTLLHICICLGSSECIQLLQSYHVNWYNTARKITHRQYNYNNTEQSWCCNTNVYNNISSIDWCNVLHVGDMEHSWTWLPISVQQVQ